MLIQVHGVEKPFLNAQIAIELGNQITPNLDHRYVSWQDLIPLYDKNHHLTRTTTQVKCYKLKNYKTVTRDGRIQEGLTAVLNWASKNSSFRSKTLSFSFKTASLLLVADSNCSKNSKRRRTLRERELENCRFSQSDCTAIPTATVFIIPAFDMAYFTIGLLMGFHLQKTWVLHTHKQTWE